MNKTWFSVLGLFIVIGGAITFSALTGGSLADRVSISAYENEILRSSSVKVGGAEFNVELAETSEQHTRGLSYRESLKQGDGMLFIFNPAQPVSFWMYEMSFPLDIVWIKDGKVISVERGVPHPAKNTDPKDLPTYPSPGEIDMVLELNAGEAANINIGDKVSLLETKNI